MTRSRRRRGAALAMTVPILAGAGCSEASRSAAGARGEYRTEVLRPGPLLERLPAADVIGDALGLEVADDRIYVLDMVRSRVHAFGPEGPEPRSIGREGSGPGELVNPVALRVGPEGDLWVGQADPPRVSRFRADGTSVDQYRPPYPVPNFAAVGAGRLLIPTLDRGTLLAELDADGDTAAWAVEAPIPERLRRDPLERILFYALPMTDRGREELVMLQNKHADDFSLWRLKLDPAGGRITGIDAVPLPEWLYAAMREDAEEMRREAPPDFAQGDFMVPFKGLHVGTDGAVQLVPSPSHRALLVAVPADPSSPLRAVVPSERGEHRDLVDAVLSDGRLVALYPTEIRIFGLEPAPGEEVPGR